MNIQVLHREEWCDVEGNYVPTSEIIGYRAWSADGKCFGYGETQQEAEDCLRRILWRIDPPKLPPLIENTRIRAYCVGARKGADN
jgi:hypothetical protein